jgi:hypothetical protein
MDSFFLKSFWIPGIITEDAKLIDCYLICDSPNWFWLEILKLFALFLFSLKGVPNP